MTPDELVRQAATAVDALLEDSNGSASGQEIALTVMRVVRDALREPDVTMIEEGVTREGGFYTRSITADAMATWRRMLAASPLGRIE